MNTDGKVAPVAAINPFTVTLDPNKCTKTENSPFVHCAVVTPVGIAEITLSNEQVLGLANNGENVASNLTDTVAANLTDAAATNLSDTADASVNTFTIHLDPNKPTRTKGSPFVHYAIITAMGAAEITFTTEQAGLLGLTD